MAASPDQNQLGRVGRYQLIEPIASGGMGVVYLAQLSGEQGFEKLLALKLLLPEISRDPRFVEMFLDEARIAARLNHPNVCEIFELGEDDGRYFIAMQYLRGAPLAALVRLAPADPHLRARLFASIIAQACEGLHHAHELADESGSPLAIVHRDISPPNIFVTSDGIAKVLDFGIAKARDIESKTRRDEVKGKQAYMSPEQLVGGAIDRRSDIFSLGVVFYEAITSTRLFSRESDFLVAKAILEESIDDPRARTPELSESLARVTMRALSRSPGDRFHTAREMGAAILGALAPAGPMPPPAIGDVLSTHASDTLSRGDARVARAATTTRPRRVAAGPGTAGARRPRLAIAVALAGLVAVAAVAAVALVGDGQDKKSEPVVTALVDGGQVALAAANDAGARALALDAEPRQVEVEIERPEPPEAERRTGTISIDSTPFATIYVDGTRAGVTPLIDFKVKAGKRRIRAVGPAGATKKLVVSVTAGKRAPPVILTW